MRTNKFFSHKKPAQAMVEFAIALPVLLLLLYGILEAGRLLFIYSTVVTASRQAVRYGTTTGEGGGATPVYGNPRAVVPRYQDCEGIIGAANKVGYLSGGNFTVTMQWDTGPGTGTHPVCGAGDPALTEAQLAGNSTRLVVTVTAHFTAIVPKLVPFFSRDITATSARTILYKVPIVVEQPFQSVSQSSTTTTITTSPNPSEMGQNVTIRATVADDDDPTNYPLGIVEVTGNFTGTCIIALGAGSNGTGTCVVSFPDAGTWGLTGVYTPNDEDHLPSISDPPYDHVVSAANTETHIIAVSPEPSLTGQDVTVSVTVTGGSTTPTGTVTIDGGGSVNCTVNLAGGAGSCILVKGWNKTGMKTLNATYSGDSTHKQSTAASVGHEVLDVTPTVTQTPANTPIPTETPIPTATIPPTALPTALASCTGITHGNITYSGNQMSMTVNNPFGFDLVMRDVTVTWNDDKGHQTGTDKTLTLQVAWLNGSGFWTGTIKSPQSTYTISSLQTFVPGTNTITFTFNQSYDNPETSDRIYLNWFTPGCESNPVDSNLP